MRPPPILDRVPRFAPILIVPIAALLVALGIGLGASGSNKNDGPSISPTVSLSVSNQQLVEASPVAIAPSPVPSPTPLTNRAACSAISGTDYRSGEERDWFLQNCGGPSASTATGSSAAARGQGPAGPTTVSAGEYALGDRLIIPAIGVDTAVNGVVVGGDGQMPTPVGYFNALWYDFKAFPGLGGYVDRGNLVLAGHVDCARCVNGGPGAAVFYNVRNLRPGDTIQYRTAGGQTANYVVTSAEWYLPTANWSAIVASSAADLSIITCIGTFDSSRREYTHRLVLYAKKT